MRAAVYDRFGPPDVVRIREVDKPAPGDDELLVRVRATAVNAADWRLRSQDVPPGFRLLMRLLFGFRKPRRPILGTDLAGDVEAVGKGVTKFRVGDPVIAYTGLAMGAHAEYRCVSESGAVVLKPRTLGYAEAAALPFGALTALDFLKRAKLQRGERVLVNGASGAVGSAAVQLARHFGTVVTGVCSTANVELVRSLGADRVIDYTKQDFARSGETWDVIVETVGNAPYSRCRSSLTERGRLLLIAAGLPAMLSIPWVAMTTRRRIIAGPPADKPEDLRFLVALAESGEYKPLIDRRYPLEQIVEAHRLVDSRRKRGSVVVTVATGD